MLLCCKICRLQSCEATFCVCVQFFVLSLLLCIFSCGCMFFEVFANITRRTILREERCSALPSGISFGHLVFWRNIKAEGMGVGVGGVKTFNILPSWCGIVSR